MERVFVSQRGAILLATLGLVTGWLAQPPPAAAIEPVYSGDGHGDTASGAAFSPDGRLLVIAGIRSTSVWDVASKRTLYRLPGGSWHAAYAFSPDSTRLVETGETGTRVYDARTGALQHERAGAAFAVAFSPAGDRVLIHGDTVDLWRPADDRVVRLPTRNPFTAAWSPDGTRVAVGSYYSVVDIWDANTGEPVASLPHDDTVHQVWWNTPDALVTLTHRHIRRWDTASFRAQTDIPLSYYAWFVDVTRDSRRVAVMMLHRDDVEVGVLVFDLETGKLVHTLADPHAMQVVFTADGRHLVTAQHGASVWNVETGALVRHLALTGDTDRAWPSPDGAQLVTTAGWPTPQLWDVATGERVGLLGGHSGAITSLAFTRDGRYFATASTRSSALDELAILWRRDDGRQLAALPHTAGVEHLAFSDDGNQLATGDHAGLVTTWNTTTHERVRTFTKHTCAVTGLDRRADLLLSASCDGTAILWDARTGAERHVLAAGRPITAAALTPDGAIAITAAASDTSAVVTLWDARTGAARATLAAGKRCRPAIAIAPDGTSLLGTCASTLRVWNLPSGELRHELATGGALLTATYSPDGTELLTASSDGIARRFDAARGTLRATLRGDPDGFDISADYVAGRVVTASRYTGELILWDGTTPRASVDAGQGIVHAVIRDPFDHARLFTTGEDTAGTLRVWRLR